MTPSRMKLHPKVPAALKREFRRLGSMNKLAAERMVNIRYVHDLLIDGIIPTNPSIARRLFVDAPTRARAMRHGDARLRAQRWWNHLMSPKQKEQAIEFLYTYKIETRRAKP